MPELFANDAYTTLDGDIDDNDTTLVVADGALFPTEGDFRIRIDDEFMLVTGVSGTTWTVTRAVEGMGVTESGTPADHLDGAEIRQVLTRDALMGGLASGSGDLGAQTLLTRPAAANAEDDHFDLDTLDAKWTKWTGTTLTVDLTSMPGWLVTVTGTPVQPVPAGDWTIETEVLHPNHLAAAYSGVGIVVSNSLNQASSLTGIFAYGAHNSLTDWKFMQDHFVNGAYSSTPHMVTGMGTAWGGHVFLRLVKSGTNYSWDYSSTGKRWFRIFTNSSLGYTPTYFGLSGAAGTAFNYFLRY